MSWDEFISKEKEKDYFKKIIKELKGKNFFPKREDILNAYKLTPFEEIKVVILGQDPYHTPGMAQGIAFSVPTDFEPKPPSLKNILKELEKDIGPSANAIKTKGDLTIWAKQGVFLLNTVLTVEKGQPLSHRGIGWEMHFIIESAHPSPLSAYRGFFDSKPFSKTNEYTKIDW